MYRSQPYIVLVHSLQTYIWILQNTNNIIIKIKSQSAMKSPMHHNRRDLQKYLYLGLLFQLLYHKRAKEVVEDGG